MQNVKLPIQLVVHCAIWYHLYNLKNEKKQPWRSVNFSKVTGSACNFTKIKTPPWVFFSFFKLHKWYQIAQSTTFRSARKSHDQYCFPMTTNESISRLMGPELFEQSNETSRDFPALQLTRLFLPHSVVSARYPVSRKLIHTVNENHKNIQNLRKDIS